jgi:hypothetical protein
VWGGVAHLAQPPGVVHGLVTRGGVGCGIEVGAEGASEVESRRRVQGSEERVLGGISSERVPESLDPLAPQRQRAYVGRRRPTIGKYPKWA